MRFVEFSSFEDDDAYSRLTDVVVGLDATRGTSGNRAFYLSIPPGWFPAVTQRIAASGLVDESPGSWRRVIMRSLSATIGPAQPARLPWSHGSCA